MNEMEYANADMEVLELFRKPQGPGGQLPSVQVEVLPAARAKQIKELDRRIEAMRKAMPVIKASSVCLVLILAAAMGWMKPGFTALAVTACLLQVLAGRYCHG